MSESIEARARERVTKRYGSEVLKRLPSGRGRSSSCWKRLNLRTSKLRAMVKKITPYQKFILQNPGLGIQISPGLPILEYLEISLF